MMKSSRAISHVNVQLKTNVVDFSFVHIMRVDVVNDHMSLYQSVMGIASSPCQHSYYWFRVPRAHDHSSLSRHSANRAIYLFLILLQGVDLTDNTVTLQE
jgi:hypothetical protein